MAIYLERLERVRSANNGRDGMRAGNRTGYVYARLFFVRARCWSSILLTCAAGLNTADLAL